MVKKEKKDKQKEPEAQQPRSPADALLGALGGRSRAASLVEEVVSVAGRVRGAIDDLRLLEEIRGLRAEVVALRERVSTLEARGDAPAAGDAQEAPRRRTTTTPPTDGDVPRPTRRRAATAGTAAGDAPKPPRRRAATAAGDASPSPRRRRTSATASGSGSSPPEPAVTETVPAEPTPPSSAPEADAGRS